MPTIGLCLIVKNEAHIIRRCLDRALPLADYVLVVDTGSDDGTQAAVRDFLREKRIAGEVIEEPWQNFAANRTSALRKLRERSDIDYSLMLDADDNVTLEAGFDPVAFKAGLSQDIYDVKVRCGPTEYFRPQLHRNALDVSYKGVMHEYRVFPDGCSRASAGGFLLDAIQDSARNQNPDKAKHDADVMEQALATETDPFQIARYTFYLAQARRTAGDAEGALAFFLKRAELGFWNEEIYISLYQAAQLKEVLERPDTDVIGAYLKAYECVPTRAEALHGAARYCRANDKHHQGYLLAKHGVTIPYPGTGLFLERWIYDYGLLDEFSVVSYWSGHFDESIAACRRLLNEGKIPEAQRARVRQNAQFSIDKMFA